MLHEERPEFSGLGRRRQPVFTYPASASATDRSTGQTAFSGTAKGDSDSQADAIGALRRAHPELAVWMNEAEGRTNNHIGVTESADGSPILAGTLLYQISEDQTDIQVLHFWVKRNKIVTMHSDYRLSIRMQGEPWSEKLQRSRTAPEALFVILSFILQSLHVGLDAFEARIGELEETMRNHNRTSLMNLIFERRYDLLHWNHLFIPIQEIYGAAKEAFLDSLTGHEEFKRLEFKLERVQDLLIHYAAEIDTLLTMNDAISNFRGNDIMKTLTIFTALFMPATVVGAIWGMNFDKIPYASTPWGFAGVLILIVAITALIYWWLWRKGWTGDLLYARKPREIMTGRAAGSSGRGEGAERPPRASGETVRMMQRSYTGHGGGAGGEGAGFPAPLPSRSRK